VKTFIDEAAGIDTPQKAFPILMVAAILGVSDEDASDAVTDGPKDRGVDAVFVDDATGNVIHFFQFKCVDKFENSKKNFPSAEIEKLSTYIAEMLDEDKTLQQSCNLLLWNKTQEVWDTIQKPSPEFHIHFCGNLEEMTPEEKARANTAFQRYKNFTVHHHSLQSIVKLFIDDVRPKIDRTITAVDKDFFDRTDGNVRGLICSVEAKEIVKMVSDPVNPTTILDSLFNDNVRIYLSNTNKINKKIITTALSEDKGSFWYLNNGITITCDSFSYLKARRAPQIELENVQIVNGGQTTHALFEAQQLAPDGLDDVLVLVRIIETKSEEFSLRIAESTNSQTPIKGRDLRSNDDIQKKLEVAFKAVGYFYERKRNQFQNERRAVRIDSLECAQAFAAYHLGFPEVAKKDRGKLFAELYDTVFTDDLTVPALLCPYLLMVDIDFIKKQVQKSIRNETLDEPLKLFLIDGAFHVLYAVSLMRKKEKIGENDYPVVRCLIPLAMTLVQELVAQEMEKDDAFSFNQFFKSSNTRELIVGAIAK
jgi:hypothetical protein